MVKGPTLDPRSGLDFRSCVHTLYWAPRPAGENLFYLGEIIIAIYIAFTLFRHFLNILYDFNSDNNQMK